MSSCQAPMNEVPARQPLGGIQLAEMSPADRGRCMPLLKSASHGAGMADVTTS